MTAKALSPVRSAIPELIALGAAGRPDWPEVVIAGVLRQALDGGMPWETALQRLPKLMTDPDAQPGDLLPKKPPLTNSFEPGASQRGAALARELRPDLFGSAGAA